MPRNAVTLDDKYDLSAERVFVSGTQALVRLTLMQKERDRRAGLNTAGYVTGYRGSPLGGLDQQFSRAVKVLTPADVKFQAAINEDLAATALWGSQQLEVRGQGRFDGVFGIWYGKGPGVDRSGDVFRHANLAGTSPHGGVIALMGDDHTCESSTTAHHSEYAMVDAMMPVLNPAGVQEILDFGLYGWALSRYAGVWVGLKCVKDTVESTAVVDGRVDRVAPVVPEGHVLPPGGLHLRPQDHPLAQEARLHEDKMPAVLAWLAANRLDRIVMAGGRAPRIGVVAAGKSWLDVLQALDDLGIDEVRAGELGLRLYKVACPWPLEPSGLARFADGLDLIVVVEEKRALIETQIKDQLYGRRAAPQIVGKRDEEGRWLFPSKGALDTNDIAVAIGERILRHADDADIRARVARLAEAQRVLAAIEPVALRTPYFCAGCPHSTSTRVPEGHRAYAGIGCHFMAQWMDRATEGYTHMGGEGANWIGEAPFSKETHIFQNLGDGTYNHSGSLALRAAKASGVNITYKILYNDAVAMTGGQAHDGGLTLAAIARQAAAEGAVRVAVVTDEPDKYPPDVGFPPFTTIDHRDALDRVQRELAAIPGLTVLLYDQTCAAEKRRRRKRGTFPDPDKRVLVNELVCEGCGDCGVQSNCVAVAPVETEFGRKRQIDQSSCNKDFSCVKGFCPSFVTVHGAKPKRAAAQPAATASNLPEPDLPALDRTFAVIVTGVGGTGVVTVGAILGMAAHLEGRGIGIIDMAGLAQKGGAVTSHIRLAPAPEDITTIRIAAGGADLIIGCDLVVTASPKVLAAIDPARTAVVVNTHETTTGDATRRADFSLPTERLIRAIRERAGPGLSRFTEATRLATALLGDSIGANLFMLGLAWQMGRVPLGRQAIEEAIALNGAAVAFNLAAFRLGRQAAVDPGALEGLVRPAAGNLDHRRLSESLDERIARRVDHLTAYQDAAYAARYRQRIEAIRAAEARALPGRTSLTEAATVSLFRLMAVKDEYEVARLHADGRLTEQLGAAFESWDRLEVHLAPPLLARTDPATGRPAKMRFGAWMFRAFRLLAAARSLRGGLLDPFRWTEERRMERRLLAEQEALLDEIARALTPANHAAAVALLEAVATIRGFGPVKAASVQRFEDGQPARLAAFRHPARPTLTVAAE
ncbi:indolepyruvate ferredoxin oxidoreductase [Prosthecomicrobium hirschii]|uniref:Indolepyruvate ferredoxin oxidoreductase n=1 Tax=Prosthecodimorpha hirschii TaxID=665126 RepID=A0A0P6W247_9HYPH|nr:indolepyruvate ferredoxin oxidoreductase family protein [Prosthecomicrobium hirschii]KPL52301.1 indolepyruvate ferredoxin oxidoreductase [Prosthecomicrobium hirschii]